MDLTDDQAIDYPSEIVSFAMDDAEAWIGTMLDIQVPEIAIVGERHDFSDPQAGWNTFLKVRKTPVKSIQDIKFYVGQTPILQVPDEWPLQVINGQIQIVPSAGTSARYPLQAMSFFQNAYLSAYSNNIPGLYSISYTAGFNIHGTPDTYSVAIAGASNAWTPAADTYPNGALTITLASAQAADKTFTVKGFRKVDGKPLDGVKRGAKVAANLPETIVIPAGQTTVTTDNEWSNILRVEFSGVTGNVTFSGASVDPSVIDCPRDVLGLMGMYASRYLLNIAGDLIAGAGIANKSISFNGVSQSIGTTSSPENSGFSARIKQYESQIKQILPMLRRKYQGAMIGVA